MKLLTTNDVDNLSHELLVPYFLMASYGYYILNQIFMEDTVFDYLCRRLEKVFDDIQHPHKYLITKEDLAAGTGYRLKHEDYPTIVVEATKRFMYEPL